MTEKNGAMSQPAPERCPHIGKDLEAIFHFLTPEERMELCPYLDRREVEQGAIVMEEGEPADSMAFVISGSLAVKKQSVFPGKYTLVAVLERGAMVGEISVLDRTERTATVEAREPCRLFVLTSDRFERLLEEKPRLGVKILRRILHVVGMRIRLADDRLARLL